MKDKIIDLYKKYKEIINYLIFGVLSMAVNFGLYFILTRVLHLEEILSSGISWFITVLFVYITNKMFVFEKTNKGILVELISFYISRIVTGILCDICIFTLFFKVMKINDFISKILVQIFTVILNYVFSKFVIFRKKEKTENEEKVKYMKKKMMVIIPYTIVVVLLSLLFSYKFEISENGYVVYDTLKDSVTSNVSETVKNGDIITQKYTIAQDKIKYTLIYFNTNNVIDDDGEYLLEILNSDGNVVLSKVIDYPQANSIDNAYKVDLKGLEKGEYTIKLTYSGEETDFSPLVNKVYKDNTYNINGEEYSGLLQTKALYCNLIKTILFYVIMSVFFIIFTILLYVVLVKKADEKIEKKFLYLAIPIYLLYMIFIPLYVAHDELFHWYRIFEITEGGLLPEIKDNSTGYMMPSAIGSGLPWGDLKYIDIIKESIEKIDYNDKTFISDVTMSVYSPVQYLPQVLGVIWGKLTVKSPIIISYCGRLFNLAICITLIYFAIKKIPFGKELIFVVSFIPIAIEGLTSLSGDGFTLSVAMLFISYIIEIYYSKRKLLKKDYFILCTLGVIIAFCKIVYIPVVFLLLLLPKESFGSNKKKYIITISLIMAFLICNLVWLALANPYLNVYTNGKSGYQVKYVLTHPIKYIQNFLYTIQTNGIGYITEMFGYNMLWSGAVLNKTFVPLTMIGLVVYICLNGNLKKKFDFKAVMIITFIVLCVVALIFTSLYVQWSRYRSEIIDGVQGRYFLPIIVLVFLLIGNFIGRENDEKYLKIDKILTTSCIFISFMCLVEMLIKYI